MRRFIKQRRFQLKILWRAISNFFTMDSIVGARDTEYFGQRLFWRNFYCLNYWLKNLSSHLLPST